MSDIEKLELIKNIDLSLDEIRPHLAVDGGNIEVVDITDNMTVQVRWMGNCINCTMAAMTMKAGVEQTIKSKHPNILSIEAINDSN